MSWNAIKSQSNHDKPSYQIKFVYGKISIFEERSQPKIYKIVWNGSLSG